MDNNKSLEIPGCSECPCCDMLDMVSGYSCNLKKKDDNGKYLTIEEGRKTGMPITPYWCPLKQSSITISIKKD